MICADFIQLWSKILVIRFNIPRDIGKCNFSDSFSTCLTLPFTRQYEKKLLLPGPGPSFYYYTIQPIPSTLNGCYLVLAFLRARIWNLQQYVQQALPKLLLLSYIAQNYQVYIVVGQGVRSIGTASLCTAQSCKGEASSRKKNEKRESFSLWLVRRNAAPAVPAASPQSGARNARRRCHTSLLLVFGNCKSQYSLALPYYNRRRLCAP